MFVAPLQTSTIELFAIIVDSISLKPLTFLAKKSVLDIWLGTDVPQDMTQFLKFKQEDLSDSK